MAMMSITGLYNWDNSIFDGFSLPDGMDKEIAINNIMLECAELEVLYSSPEVMKFAITNWCAKNFRNWQKMWTAFNLEYNPIWNKDGVIEESEEYTADRNDGRNRNTSGTNSSETNTTTSGTDTAQETGFNSETFVNGSKTISSGSTAENSSGENGETMEETGNGHEETVRKYTRKETGNIGVTTSQQMLKEEYEVAVINIYDMITTDFKRRFCILVY